MLLLVVGGLGLAVDPISIAVIFVLGLAAAMLGPLPGGLGTTEASLAAMLGMVGVAASAAAGVVVAFRLFDFWLPTVFGFAVGACTSSRRTRATRERASRDVDVAPARAQRRLKRASCDAAHRCTRASLQEPFSAVTDDASMLWTRPHELTR